MLTVFAITIAAAEVGVALAVVLLLYRVRRTSDLDAVRELGAASPTYSEDPLSAERAAAGTTVGAGAAAGTAAGPAPAASTVVTGAPATGRESP